MEDAVVVVDVATTISVVVCCFQAFRWKEETVETNGPGVLATATTTTLDFVHRRRPAIDSVAAAIVDSPCPASIWNVKTER